MFHYGEKFLSRSSWMMNVRVAKRASPPEGRYVNYFKIGHNAFVNHRLRSVLWGKWGATIAQKNRYQPGLRKGAAENAKGFSRRAREDLRPHRRM